MFCICIWATAKIVHSADISISKTIHIIEAEDYGQSEGFLIEVGDKFRAGISCENITGRFVGQEAVKITLCGFQVSRRFELMPQLYASLGLGYYIPKLQETKAFREAMWLEINRIYHDHAWTDPDVYQYRLYPNFGGILNLEYSYPIYGKLSFKVDMGYRFLNLHENIRRIQPQSDSYVEFGRDRSLSGGFFGAGVNWVF